jgi:hypothetical protein
MPKGSCPNAFDQKVVVHLTENGFDLPADILTDVEDGFGKIRGSAIFCWEPKDAASVRAPAGENLRYSLGQRGEARNPSQ